MSEAERAGESRQDKSERLLAGRYRLGDVLGRGGMGTVWRAEDETLGRTVAVKELRFPSAIDEEEKRRLITRTLREAKAIARIRNNGAVTVFDVVDEDNRPWIVMELIEGKSLAEAIREDGVLTPRRAAEVGLAILDVLQAAHREGILHRDVKPSNVLISGDDGRVVLTDFGIAQVEGDPSITSTGMLVGAPSYISPERARGHKPGPAADLWSLGGLLYASVEGVPPYDKGSAIATLTAVMTEPVEQPKNAGPLENVIYGLLAKDPEQRLDDAGARAMLTEVLRKTEPEGSAPEPPDATKVVAMPPLPKDEEPSERLRGALRSVRKAATAAGAATAAATSAARAKKAGGPDSSRAEGAARTASPQTGPKSAADAGQGGASAPATTANASVPGQTGGSDGKRGGSGSGWPAAPERPARPAPKASLTDVVPLRTLVIIVVVVALAVVGTVLAITIGGGDDNGAKGGSGGTKATASTGATSGSGKSGGDDKGGKSGSDSAHTDSDGKSGSDSGSDDSANTSSDPDTDASASDGSSGDGKESGSGSTAVKTYKSSQGFTIGLPKGWKYQSQDAAGARFTGPDEQKLLVGWTSTPKDDPVADWENQERYMVRSQYKKIHIEHVSYRGWNTADWEFTYVDGGTKFHSIDRGFVVNAHQGYALMYTAKDSAWDSALRKSTWATLTGTFQPKP
ncbi:serine/threonine-protein kinase [Streptomyces triticiradicis]|uniref:non-specific serine/threonine protein kinase n=1 Tax=Streptomyces triticiradicis TaxID=2651189 RepID=A0A7J5DJ62_9ACTN|nr:serine/threonine-protein kinase [Streptomyces triticiradicis]KAB1988695.1 serine/threonine protein kinase [Streptomyces triticiradicis]